MAIFEQREKAIWIQNPDESESLYFSNPFESTCKENFTFLFKHLQAIQFESGIHTLLNKDLLQDTHYKHLSYKFTNLDDTLRLQAKIAYVTETPAHTLSAILKSDAQLIPCPICASSIVRLATGNGEFQTIYSQQGELQAQSDFLRDH